MHQAGLQSLSASSPKNAHPDTILYFQCLYCPTTHHYAILSLPTFYLLPHIHFCPTFSPLSYDSYVLIPLFLYIYVPLLSPLFWKTDATKPYKLLAMT